MKQVILFIFASVAFLFAGSILTSCQSSAQKVDDAQSKVVDAKDNLKEAQKDANAEAVNRANEEQWQAFKNDSDAKIKANESLIADLKAKMKASGKKIDAVYVKSMDALEQKNKDLKAKVDGYDNKAQNNWDSFKTEFNHDMDELGHALKDLTVDNKK